MTIVKVGEVEYGVNSTLLKIWKRNSLEILKKTNSDRVYIVDGRERIGKSTFVIQQMGVLDPQAFTNIEEFKKRICLSSEKFNKACRELTNSVIIFDEAFRGLSSRAALSKINKLIIQTLMEMGQNNNIVFIVLPRIFLLDVYPAMLRSHGLFHIDLEAHDRRKRMWTAYNEADKNRIYQIGIRKGWTYPAPSPIRGGFSRKFPGGKEFEEAYLQMKAEAFKNKEEVEEEGDIGTKRYENLYKQRDEVLKMMFTQYKSFPEFYKAYKEQKGELSLEQLRRIIKNNA